MNEEIKKMLDEEIKEEFHSLSSLQAGSKEKATAIENLETLYRLKIDETKIEIDLDEKRNRRGMDDESAERDIRLKQVQLEEQVKDRYFRIGIEAAGIILPLVFYAVWMRRGLKFEETGAYTSTTFRGLFNRFKPTK